MFRYNLIVAVRRLLRNRLHALINIGGLAIGLATVTMIGLYVAYELSYDRWLKDIDRLYKVEFTETEPGHAPLPSAMTPAPLAAALLKDYAGIEEATRLAAKIFPVRLGARQFNETIYFTDPNFFRVFSLPMVDGTGETALMGEGDVAISARMAAKYFGTRAPLGEVLTIGPVERRVSAVFETLPGNSHFDPDFIMRVGQAASSPLTFRETWGSDQVHTYLKVRPGFDARTIERDGRAFAERNISLDWTKLPPADLHHYNVLPVADIHLRSDKDNHEKPVSHLRTVLMFALVALLVLALAVINFTNLSTVQALRCAREVAIRKVVGARRSQLVAQFMGEAMLTTFVALVIGLAMVELALPKIRDLLGIDLTLAPFGEPAVLVSVLCLWFVTSLVAGLYPALVLSGFRPSLILGSGRPAGMGAPRLRNLLVVLQFAVAIGLVAATSVIYRQSLYVQALDLGFDPAGKLVLQTGDPAARAASVGLKHRLAGLEGVSSVSATSAELPGAPHGLGVFLRPGASRDEARSITVVWTDGTFLDSLGLAPVAGRLFSRHRQADFRIVPDDPAAPIRQGVVLNQTALALLGYGRADAAIGDILTLPGDRPTLATVVGVVPDIHLGSLHKAVGPVAFFATESPLGRLVVDAGNTDRAALLARVAETWADLVPGVPMAAEYLDDAYAGLYLETDRQGMVFATAALLAVLVACLGLYGLAAYIARRRTREIGIRKVLGARVLDIVLLLTWQFSQLVLIAAPFGILVALWGTRAWLTSFAYRISLVDNLWIFAASALAAFGIAWLTVGGQAAQVARLSPARALRYE